MALPPKTKYHAARYTRICSTALQKTLQSSQQVQSVCMISRVLPISRNGPDRTHPKTRTGWKLQQKATPLIPKSCLHSSVSEFRGGHQATSACNEINKSQLVFMETMQAHRRSSRYEVTRYFISVALTYFLPCSFSRRINFMHLACTNYLALFPKTTAFVSASHTVSLEKIHNQIAISHPYNSYLK